MLFGKRLLTAITLVLLVSVSASVFAIGEDEAEPSPAGEAQVINDEGGPVVVTGEVSYSNPFFTLGTAQPLVILEDQAGFVDRNEFFLFPPESQVLGQITSDFYSSPFTYTLSLPIEPQGTLRDVDNDGEEDTGVMVFAVAYWSNTFGDPFLEERDQYGGGWSTAYASTEVSTNPDTLREIIGGKFIVYAPDDEQAFPTGFGPDGLLFTDDDPTAPIPAGYSVVNLDTDPFTFDRSREQRIDLIEPEGAAADDFSGMSYTEAFDAMVEKLTKEYAFTEYYNIDWQALSDTYRPRVEEAQAASDATQFALALRDFLWEIPDGHVGMSLDLLIPLFQRDTEGGLGIAIRELDDGRVIVNFLLDGSPADEAGIELGAEIIAFDGVPIDQKISETFIWASQALGTEHTRRLQQLRYVTRFPMGTTVDVTYRNPGGEEQTVTMEVVPERESFAFSSFNQGLSGTELPVEFRILDSGYGYIAIYSFSDNEFLTVELWERALRTFREQDVPGVIIDMRQNGGGSGFLADQMAAYFFDEPLILGNTGRYNEDIDDFFFDERGVERFYLPPEEDRYRGEVAVIIEPSCFSACEFFSYDMTLQDRAAIVGHYPTGGLGGSIEQFFMPENISIVFTAGRAVDAEGNIHIEGQGVAPTHDVPVTAEALLSDEDVLLRAAEDALRERIRGVVVDGGTLSFGEALGTVSATGRIAPGESVEYRVVLPANSIVNIYAGDDAGELDTVLRIYDESGSSVLVENDDAGDGVNSALEGLDVGPEALSVRVAVALKEDQPAGDFFLRIEASPAEAS